MRSGHSWKWKKCLAPLLAAVSVCMAASSIPARAETTPEERKTVFIGDSRTVGCYIAESGAAGCTQVEKTDANGDYWSAKVGQGIDWAVSTGIPEADGQIQEDTDAVILIGVNDTYSTAGLEKTVETVNEKAAEWKARGARTFFVSILPIRRAQGGFTNEKISSWNSYLQENLSEDVYWIDLVTPTEGILQYSDNFHFQMTTYEMIYQYVKIVTEYTAAVEGD